MRQMILILAARCLDIAAWRWRVLLALLAAMAIGSGLAAPNFPNGTYVVLGNAKNWKNASYDSTDEVTVRAVATNGTILAEATVSDAAQGRNFALQIPLSTQPSEKTAQVGDTIRLWTVYGKQLGAASEPLTVGSANSHAKVDLMVQEVAYFATTNTVWTNNYPSLNLPIAQAYLDELQPWMDAYNLTYSPDDDWDRDGRSNYFEYLAGTHPLDNTDHLSISSIEVVRITDSDTKLDANGSSSRIALTFECVKGHTYVIPASTELKGKAWANKRVATTPEADPSSGSEAYTAVGKEDGDTVTLYMLPAIEAKREFFTVQPK